MANILDLHEATRKENKAIGCAISVFVLAGFLAVFLILVGIICRGIS